MSLSPFARSDSRFRRDWFEESRPFWPLLVAHLFTWNDKYFDQPLPQHAIGWEGLSALSHFFLECTPSSRRNTRKYVGLLGGPFTRRSFHSLPHCLDRLDRHLDVAINDRVTFGYARDL